ncbi:MAG: carbohydrate ABC transporter permease [Ruminiclostridium sp.]|nr:carbohydrate ABC transporter permease [Ruminiclostridium sp.]
MASHMEYIDKGNKTSLLIAKIVSYIFLVFVTVLSLFSFYLLIINATRSNAQLQAGFTLLPKEHFIDNLVTAWNDQSIFFLPQGMLNSFIVSACTCIISTYFSAMTAYGVCVYDFKGRNVAHKFIILVMMIPTQVSALGFVKLVNALGLTNTYWPLIIPAIAAPATYFYMKQYIDSTLPLEIVEAARVDGSNEFRTFNFICTPILKPALAVQMIFSFVGTWNNFFTPALILDKKEVWTLPIMLSVVRSRINSQAGDMGEVYMIILLAIVPVVVVYLFLSKFIIGGVTLGSVKG